MFRHCLKKTKERNKSIFEDTKQRIGEKLAGWKVRTLLIAGKDVLIKSCLTSIPEYTMKWPKTIKYIRRHIDNANRSFFWKDNHDNTSNNYH